MTARSERILEGADIMEIINFDPEQYEDPEKLWWPKDEDDKTKEDCLWDGEERKKDNRLSVLNISIPKHLMKSLKDLADAEGTTIKKWIVELLEKEVQAVESSYRGG